MQYLLGPQSVYGVAIGAILTTFGWSAEPQCGEIKECNDRK
jgi:hypothetical protein